MTRHFLSVFLTLLVTVFCFPLVGAFAQQPAYQVGVIPPEPPPSIPPSDDIIIFVHGGPGSRLEEASDLVNPLLAAGLLKNKRYTIISFDQPSQGYSSMIDPTSTNPLHPCNPLDPTSGPDCGLVPDHDQIHDYYPLLAASDEFIVGFVNALDATVPGGIKNRNIYIIGGSTGGALTLRMGRDRPDTAWLTKIVAWNPASVWNTYAIQNPTDVEGAAKGLLLDAGFGRAKDTEDPTNDPTNSRRCYFAGVFGKPLDPDSPCLNILEQGVAKFAVSVQPNPEEWYRGDRDLYYVSDADTQKPFRADWECKWDYIGAARLEQQEIYNAANRHWHYRLGAEILIFSFFNNDWLGPAKTAPDKSETANYLNIHKPTMLVASDDDDWDEGYLSRGSFGLFTAWIGSYAGVIGAILGGSVGAAADPVYFHWENRWTQIMKMAPKMTNTPGYTLYVPNTGHSIHTERPNFFAQQIVNFFSSAGPTSGPLMVNPVFDEAQMPPEQRGWAGEAPLGGWAQQIAVAANKDGRLEVFYVGTDNSIYHNAQTSAGDGWAGQAPLGGSAKQLAVGTNSDGRLEIFYVGTDDNIYHNWQTSPGGNWAGQASMGDKAKQIAVGRNSDGRLEIFYLRPGNSIYHNWQTAAGDWSGGVPLADAAQQITVAANKDGRLEVFYIVTNNYKSIYHNWQTAAGDWSGPAPLGGAAKQIAVGKNSDGRLEIFYVGTDDSLYHNWQTPAGDWAGEIPLGGSAGSAKQTVVGVNSDGRLEVFYARFDDRISHNRQNSPGGSWEGEIPLGGYGKQVAVGANSDGRLEIFYLRSDNSIYHNWQNSAGGGCPTQVSQFQPIPSQFLENPDAANFLMEPARRGGKFSDGSDPGTYSLRLNTALRHAGSPVSALAKAAARYYGGDAVWGNAFADLAVTGRIAYTAFQTQPPTENDIKNAMGIAQYPDPTKLTSAVQAALSRAYQVAWALRNPNPDVAYQFRQQLGWIAVSGEDDPPARPVNVPGGIPVLGAGGKQVSTYPQYELTVAMCTNLMTPPYAPHYCPPGTSGSIPFQIRYTVAGLPEITSLDSTNVPPGKASMVKITGANFVGIQSVSPAYNFQFTINSPTEITVNIPDNLPMGTYPIQVSTGAGYSSRTVNLYVRPIITGISPNSGSYLGGTTVTVTGEGLAKVEIRVDAKPAVSASPTGPACSTFTTCLIAVPPHDPSTVPVDVLACIAGVCSLPIPADQFTYLPPAITSISPSSGPVSGGTQVNIRGTGLGQYDKVDIFFGGVKAQKVGCIGGGGAPQCFGAISPPNSRPQAVDITVQASGFPSATSRADLFTYEAYPKLKSISYDYFSVGWVEINGYAPPGGAVVSLAVQPQTPAVQLPQPPSVTVPAGNRGSFFALRFPPSATAGTVTLTASYQGSIVSAHLPYYVYEPPPITISIDSVFLGTGKSTIATVSLLNPAPSGGALVALSSSDPSAVPVPTGGVTIVGDSYTATFKITNNYSGKSKKVVITAKYNGNSATAYVMVPPPPAPPLSGKSGKGSGPPQ